MHRGWYCKRLFTGGAEFTGLVYMTRKFVTAKPASDYRKLGEEPDPLAESKIASMASSTDSPAAQQERDFAALSIVSDFGWWTYVTFR